jgi:predicted RNase H-like nuclease (RuvC/YqgF family)
MDDHEREELIWRRLSDKVADNVDKQLKSRYFWAAVLFAGVSWFGGVALIQNIVQSRVAEKMEPAQMAVAGAKVLSDQLSNSLNEAQKNATKLGDSLRETNQRLQETTDNEKRLGKELEKLQSDAELAISEFNKRIELLSQAVTQSDSARNTKEQAIAKLQIPQVVIRLGAGAPQALVQNLSHKIASSGHSVSIEGGRVFIGSSSLRYFYKTDEALAKEIAQTTTNLLRESGVETNKDVPTVDLSGLPIKPPERTVELWLNFSDGRLL